MCAIYIMVELEVYNEWLLEEELVPVDWKTQISKGNYFIKHHRWGKAKLRRVWIDEEFENIYWSNPNDECNLKFAKGSIKIKDVKEVKEGLVKSKIGNRNANQRNKCTFSLITKARTLELECNTQVTFTN